MIAPGKIWVVFSLPSRVEGILLQGIFYEEHEAVYNCARHEGIALIPIGQMCPVMASDLEIIYWPHETTWAESRLYKLREQARKEVARFFGGVCR